MSETENLLEIKDLVIHYETDDAVVEAVNNISFDIKPGEIVGVVGETGAGKTTIGLSLLGILPKPPANIIKGSIKFKGQEIAHTEIDFKRGFLSRFKNKKKHEELILQNMFRNIRGNQISMIFQDPMSALNPVIGVGEQIAEVIRIHDDVFHDEAKKRAEEMLELVNISSKRYEDFPHQFSGGMKQRVIIAIALACKPDLIIADEPTTALDVTIQAQILEMMKELQKETKTAMLFITHDFGVVADICDRCMVIYAGEIVESGCLEHIFDNPTHPYTQGLFKSIPNVEVKKERLDPIYGTMPNPMDLPPYCSFYDRCENRVKACKESNQELVEIEPGHFVKCGVATSKKEVV